uniref:Putative secreted protein n=1 Tax=Ixodes ricinus TaxID=34613 RepID=A0A6B0TWL1_IXORI
MPIMVWIIPLLSPLGTNHGTPAPTPSQKSVNNDTGRAEATISQALSCGCQRSGQMFQKGKEKQRLCRRKPSAEQMSRRESS